MHDTKENNNQDNCTVDIVTKASDVFICFLCGLQLQSLAKLQVARSGGDEQRRPALAIQGVDRAASIQQDAQHMRQLFLAGKMDWHALQPIRHFHIRAWQ